MSTDEELQRDITRAALRALRGTMFDKDIGFEIPMFIAQLDRVQDLRPEQVTPYNVGSEQLDAIKQRFGEWVAELRSE